MVRLFTPQTSRASTQSRRARWSVGPLIAVLVLLSMPLATSAHDGEIIAAGGNVISNVYVDGYGKGHVVIQNVGDCPYRLGTCFVQVRWLTKCQWIWCLGFDDRSGWVALPQGQDWASWCYGEKSQWQVQLRWGWNATARKTVEYWGQTEYVVGVNGGVSYPYVGKFGFDATDQTGWRYGAHISTDYAAYTAYSDAVTVATSAGSWLYPNC
jgi:hypothetical protein